MPFNKELLAKAYRDLVKAGRKAEEDVPAEIKPEYDALKEAESKS
ncbi:hypothetical protein [Paenibacillus sp. sgz500958]